MRSKSSLIGLLVLLSSLSPSLSRAQAPRILNYQGWVAVGGTNFDGAGQFKFALVNGAGSAVYWSNGVNAVTCTVIRVSTPP